MKSLPESLVIAVLSLAFFLPLRSSESQAQNADQVVPASAAAAPAFKGNFLGMDLDAAHLGVVLDISESMTRSLPAIREALRVQMPKTPVVHVDGCRLEKPAPRAKLIGGTAPETVTAVDLLAQHAGIDAVLWISDMADPPNRAGIEAMAMVLSEHGIRLLLMSLRGEPGPSLRKLVEQSDGAWQIVPTARSERQVR